MARDNDQDSNEGSFGETRFARRAVQVATVLNEKTSFHLNFKTIIPILSVFLFCVYRVSTLINRIERRFESTWTVNDQEKWTRQFRKDNPNVLLPDTREIFESGSERKVKLIE